MIDVMKDLPPDVLGFTAHGKVTAWDYDAVLTPELESRFRDHRKLSLLYHFADDFSGFQVKAMWKDTLSDLRHFRSWRRVAVVTDVGWIRRMATFVSVLRPGRQRAFPEARLEEAREWVSS